LYFLVRKEPFTSLARSQQGGKFDLANRLFFSVTGAWETVLSGKGDTKELLPDFFDVFLCFSCLSCSLSCRSLAARAFVGSF
jgi:hypothetical protein